mmetsp:Transcript_8194/g.24403  ORF Transcript_8194/g.24403 Transcript_8194/m.24403 type:complete len:353 (+) Transcript_8194:3150-4208(+)
MSQNRSSRRLPLPLAGSGAEAPWGGPGARLVPPWLPTPGSNRIRGSCSWSAYRMFTSPTEARPSSSTRDSCRASSSWSVKGSRSYPRMRTTASTTPSVPLPPQPSVRFSRGTQTDPFMRHTVYPAFGASVPHRSTLAGRSQRSVRAGRLLVQEGGTVPESRLYDKNSCCSSFMPPEAPQPGGNDPASWLELRPRRRSAGQELLPAPHSGGRDPDSLLVSKYSAVTLASPPFCPQVAGRVPSSWLSYSDKALMPAKAVGPPHSSGSDPDSSLRLRSNSSMLGKAPATAHSTGRVLLMRFPARLSCCIACIAVGSASAVGRAPDSMFVAKSRLVSLVNVSGADHDGGIEPVKSL